MTVEQKYVCGHGNFFVIYEHPQFPDYRVDVHFPLRPGATLQFAIELSQLDLTGNKQTKFEVFKINHDGSRTERLCWLLQASTGKWHVGQIHRGYIIVPEDDLYVLTAQYEKTIIDAFANFVAVIDPYI